MVDPKTEQAEEIFFDAQDVAGDVERRAFVESACGGDAGLQTQVEDMLAAQADVESFFREGAPLPETMVEIAGSLATEAVRSRGGSSNTDFDEKLGTWIGPYKLLEKLGEGGHGTVYMAGQEEPVRRQVALKIIKPGMDTRSVIARFEAERQALAMMDHPGISRVLDAGATETGRPFFVMELVNGTRVTDYCDENKLGTRHRLELFIHVCQAIQHAHHKGIIHRDIKPSNILVVAVDGSPLPKVIDFGIAKAIEEKLTEKSLFTLHGHFIGTPVYMSPEQAQMSVMDVDTRSDIYSLGVLLYELLTGKTPFDEKDLLASGIDGMRRMLREKEPPRPSARLQMLSPDELTVAARQRNTEPPTLRSEVAGDLDWIVMQALETDRGRRYQTAYGLAVDVRRYLDNEPISARPPTRLYRLQKLVRRNKAVFTAGTAAALAMTSGFAFSTCMYFRERTAREEQVRLREVADRALANEATLRREADARSRISQAAILLNRNSFKQADDWVGKLSLPVIQPSLEAADVYRRLAIWNVTQGNWESAASRLLKLVEANQIDKTDMTEAATRDSLMVGPVLVLIGDTAGYELFRQSMITRFAETSDPVAAEQVIKASTLLPLDQNTIKALGPLARIVEAVPAGSRGEGWLAFALTRFEYRCGNDAGAIAWARKCLAFRDAIPTRTASCHVILAFSQHRLGQTRDSRAELAMARALIGPKFPQGLAKGMSIPAENRVYWYDWLEALLLLNEAASEIEGRMPSPLLPEPLPPGTR